MFTSKNTVSPYYYACFFAVVAGWLGGDKSTNYVTFSKELQKNIMLGNYIIFLKQLPRANIFMVIGVFFNTSFCRTHPLLAFSVVIDPAAGATKLQNTIKY